MMKLISLVIGCKCTYYRTTQSAGSLLPGLSSILQPRFHSLYVPLTCMVYSSTSCYAAPLPLSFEDGMSTDSFRPSCVRLAPSNFYGWNDKFKIRIGKRPRFSVWARTKSKFRTDFCFVLLLSYWLRTPEQILQTKETFRNEYDFHRRRFEASLERRTTTVVVGRKESKATTENQDV